MATTGDIVRRIADAITGIYGREEAVAIARMVVMDRTGMDLTRMALSYGEECTVDGMDAVVGELQRARPVQYVLGHTEFCGADLKVDERVLIPRPETAELVGHVAAAVPAGARIFDVCTGSGAIAVALAMAVPGARVKGSDISEDALCVARENAVRNGVEVEFVRSDALGDFRNEGSFDAMVSNPPYVPQRDLQSMRANVKEYEPHGALFVPDDDPLLFYRSIAGNAYDMLVPGGTLWFEIYEEYAEETCRLLRKRGFSDAEWVADANGKPRIVWCRR